MGYDQFDPRRDSARAVGRHLDRRAAGRDPASGWLPRRRRRVRGQRAHPAQHLVACRAHRRRPPESRIARSTTRWCPPGTCTRSWRSCWKGGIRCEVARSSATVSLLALRPRPPCPPSARRGRHRPRPCTLAGPADHRVQRPGRPRPALGDHQRLGRRARLFVVSPRPAGPSASPTSTRTTVDVEALAPAGAQRGLGRRHRRQRQRAASRSASTGCTVGAGPHRRDARRGTGSSTPRAATTPSRCSSTARAGCTWSPRPSPAASSTGLPRG